MIVERTENPQWLSNAYLVADPEAGTGVLIDGNDELGPLLERAERDGIEITHILVTHPHGDHIAGLAEARKQLGNPPLVAHEATAAELDEEVEVTLADGDKLRAGSLEVEAIYTPGHAAGHLAFLDRRQRRLHRRRPLQGHGRRHDGAGRQRLRRPQGLGDAADGAAAGDPRPPRPPRADDDRRAEWESNPFVRIWRGLDATGEESVTVWDRPATLKLWAPDYDGGNKAWIVFGDSSEEAIVGGSQVVRG